MELFGRRYRDRLAAAAALVLPVAVAAVLVPWRKTLPDTDVALLLVVVVVAVAANGHRGPGLLAALSSAVWFDFFWTVPYERFTITSHIDVETTVLLLLVGAAVSELAARGRRARRVLRTDTAYLAAIHETAGLAAVGRVAQEVVDQVEKQLVALLGLRGARFEQGNALGHPPRLDDDGELVWGDGRWDIEENGFPNEDVELRARSGGRTWGRFMMTPVPGTAPSAEARQVAVVLAQQVGVVLAGQAAGAPSLAHNGNK